VSANITPTYLTNVTIKGIPNNLEVKVDNEDEFDVGWGGYYHDPLNMDTGVKESRTDYLMIDKSGFTYERVNEQGKTVCRMEENAPCRKKLLGTNIEVHIR
jgi:hypothetical protein